MPEWLIWMAVVWFFFAVTGGRRCGRARLGRDRHHALGGANGEVRSVGRGLRGVRGELSSPRVPPAGRVESPEQRLQREFVEGRLTLDEYEAALWRELRPGR